MSQPHPALEQPEGCFHWLCFKTWSVLFLSILLGVVFIAIALIQFFVYSNSYSTRVTYSLDGKCQGSGTGTNCQVQIDLGQDLQPPILLMYALSGAYINHRKYIDSISADQLLGKAIDMKAAEKACTPFVTNKDMNVNTSYGGTPLNPDNIAYPCGFEPFLTFNDSFSLYNAQGNKVNIDETNLNPEYSKLFTSRQGSENDQWISVKNEHFHEWTKNQALIGKYKLWGRINEPLQKGKYNLVVSNVYHINNLKIAKGIELIHPSQMGGAIYFFPICFAIMGIMCIAYAIFMKTQMGDYDQVVGQKEQ